MTILYPGKKIGDGIDVRPSNLTSDKGDPGNGLFATMAFSKGDVITTYDGEVISSRAAKALDANGRPVLQQTHMKSVDSHTVIDGIKKSVPGKGGGSFINDPTRHDLYNAKMVSVDCVEARGRNKGILGVYIVATRSIHEEDEIYMSYGKNGFLYAMPL
jgi:SET domain-containing protein